MKKSQVIRELFKRGFWDFFKGQHYNCPEIIRIYLYFIFVKFHLTFKEIWKSNYVVSFIFFQRRKVLVAQSCPTLCDPMNCSPLGSSVHGILQARTLEWVAISFSLGSSQPRDWMGLLHCRQILYLLSHQGSSFSFKAKCIWLKFSCAK